MKKTILSIFGCLLALPFFGQTKQARNATQMQDASIVRPVLRAAAAPLSTLALSGYYKQDFEGTTFPPAGWTVQNVAGPTYTWARSTAAAHAGVASAFIRYDATTGGGQDWLIAPKFQVSASTDSVVFFMRLAYSGYPPDSLCLKISTTDSLVASFGNHTLLKLAQGTNYPPNATTWYRYAVSLSGYVGQQVFLAFKHYDNDGDGLYIDDVSIGTKPANDIAASSLTLPASTGTGVMVTPQGTFVNNGSATQTFNVTATITPGGYTSTQTITALAPGASSTATFATWTPATAGTYTVTAYSQSVGDAITANDTIRQTVTVMNSFTNGGWQTHTALPSAQWATGATFAKPCISGTDTGYVYMISGGDAAFANTTVNMAYNTVTGTWSSKAAIPTSRTQVTPLQVKGKIYVIGGYGSSFSPVSTVSIYDIATNTWSTGAAMPQITGDYAAAVYRDSLIYIVGGYSGTADLNSVQVYNIAADSWSTATAKPGSAVAGGRMGISGNTIIHVGGYNQVLAANLATAQMGIIDPANPLNITWTTITNYPGGSSSRLGAGTAAQPNGEIYFGGGDPDGQGTSARNTVYAYNTATSQWEIGPNMAGVSNINAMAGVIANDTLYMVVVGGYDGTNVVGTNQWLKIGPATVPAVSANAAICTGASTNLMASNGTAYSWSPSGSLSSATIAAPTATPTATTTYTVSISQRYGCAVQKMVTVTVNPLPTVLVSNADTLCAGQSTALIASGGTMYSWTPAASLDNSMIATPVATPPSATTYTVNVTDVNGCSNTNTVAIFVTALPIADAGLDTTICAGSSAMLHANGGAAYSWTPSGDLDNSTSANPTATPAATTTYTLTATDVNGCSSTTSVMVTVNDMPMGFVFVSNVTCHGLANGTAGIGASGTGPYSYSWSTMDTTATISGLAPGAYSYILTDESTGCSMSGSIGINEPDSLVVTVAADTIGSTCDGELMADVMGGTFGYSYMWDDASMQTTNPATNLCAGTYNVTVTDSNGCTATTTGTVESSVSVDDISGTDFSVYPNPAAENLTITGDFRNVTITLMDVLGKNVLTIAENVNGVISKTIDISALPAGVYNLQLKNNAGITTKRIVKK